MEPGMSSVNQRLSSIYMNKCAHMHAAAHSSMSPAAGPLTAMEGITIFFFVALYLFLFDAFFGEEIFIL